MGLKKIPTVRKDFLVKKNINNKIRQLETLWKRCCRSAEALL